MNDILVDLYSDTVSRPTPAMRKAIAEAEVGNEQAFDDPTVNRLVAMAAELLGTEDAVFLPSGTMCNQISVLLHCRPGDEILTDKTSHIVNAEAGGAAALAGAMVRTLDGIDGVFSAEQLEDGVRAKRRHAPRSRLVAVEQTSNSGGGTVWPLATLGEVAGVAGRHGLALHMDGARLLNATVASGVSAAEFAQPFDTVWIDLSKGLGCPVGAVLAATSDAIDEAWQWKQRLGGAMRQAGVIAAAGIFALENHVERMAEDHANARHFAEALAAIPGIAVDPEKVETNMVFFDVAATSLTAAELCERLAGLGVRIGASSRTRLRAVTHLDVTRAEVEEAAEAVRTVIGEAGSRPKIAETGT